MVEGIVLAGGFSSRAKTNKMTLKYKNKELILHTISSMKEFCERVIVVTGHYHQEIVALLDNYDFVKIVYNENYPQGMFSSIKKGVEETQGDFFIIPGDYPLVRAITYKNILELNQEIVVPSFNMRLGHPIYFNRSFKSRILNTKFNNLKDFRNSCKFYIYETDDPGILMDIDNMEDYSNLIRKE